MATRATKKTAARKKAASTEIAVASAGAGSTGGKSLTNIDAQLALEVDTLRDAIGQASGNKIKLEPSGNFILPDGSNLGDEIQVVIVDFMSHNKFYVGPYNRDNPQPPVCYAMGKVLRDMAPEADSPEIQNDDCASCPMNQFGSGDNGRSKACKNTRIAAVLIVDPEDPTGADAPDAPLYTLEIPPTSIKAFDGAVSMCQRVLGGPPIKAVLTVTAKPVGTYAVMSFIDPVPNPSYALHFQRREETVDMLTRKPDFSNYEAAPARGRKAPARRAPARR